MIEVMKAKPIVACLFESTSTLNVYEYVRLFKTGYCTMNVFEEMLSWIISCVFPTKIYWRLTDVEMRVDLKGIVESVMNLPIEFLFFQV